MCWNALQKALIIKSNSNTIHYVLKIDVANFFRSINQHTLINILNDANFPKSLSSRLEAILTSYTGQRSARGILQGAYPSDLLGNFYMAPVDIFLDDIKIESARYVDDMYIFVESVDAADQLLRKLIPFLRSYDLDLNEAKSAIMPKAALITEEPDLEKLFNVAVEEISAKVDDKDFDADYGFQSEWDDDECEGDSDGHNPTKILELKANKLLFDSIAKYPGHEESIERFCLPFFSKAVSDYATDQVIDSFKKRPAMSQIYAAYIANFIDKPNIQQFLLELLSDISLLDWQKLWVLASLMQHKPSSCAPVTKALEILKHADRHEALRAVAAIYVGRYGDAIRRKELVNLYQSVSHYIQAAIYFLSRDWPGAERSNAKASWGSHSILNGLLTAAIGKK